MNHYSVAIACFIIFVSLNGCKQKKSEHYYEQAVLAYEQTDSERALSYLNKGINRTSPPAHSAFKGTILYQLGRFDESRKVFEQLLNNKNIPASLRAEIMNNYACTLNQLGNRFQAELLWQQLTKNNDYATKEVAHFNLGMLSFQDSKKFAKLHPQRAKKSAGLAIKKFTQALALEPNYTDALFYKAQAYIVSDNRKAAVQLLKKIVREMPDHEGAVQMLREYELS